VVDLAFYLDMPPIFYDIAEVIPITNVFPHIAVLRDAVACITLR
jgi:hypothetical protein